MTRPSPFRLEVLAQHDRTGFECSELELTQYFRSQVTQDVRRRVTHCFVAIESATGVVAGYYTLAATSIPLLDLPSDVARKLPRYPLVPAVLLGRLAVDQSFGGRGLGAALLADAARRSIQAPPAAFALLVEAKNERALSFYQHHGFVQLRAANRLFLPLATAHKALLGER